MPAVFIAERAGSVIYLNRVEIRFVRGIRHILSGVLRLNFGGLPGCLRLGFGGVPSGIRRSPGSIPGGICFGLGSIPRGIRSGTGSVSGSICVIVRYTSRFCGIPGGICFSPGGVPGSIRSRFCRITSGISSRSGRVPGGIGISLGSVPGCIGGIVVSIMISVVRVVVMGIARTFVPGYTTMVSVAASRASMTVTVMASSPMIAMIATLSLAAQYCPGRAEGFAFAGLMSVSNLADICSINAGAFLYEHVFDGRIGPLIVVSAVTTALAAGLVPWLDQQRDD